MLVLRTMASRNRGGRSGEANQRSTFRCEGHVVILRSADSGTGCLAITPVRMSMRYPEVQCRRSNSTTPIPRNEELANGSATVLIALAHLTLTPLSRYRSLYHPHTDHPGFDRRRRIRNRTRHQDCHLTDFSKGMDLHSAYCRYTVCRHSSERCTAGLRFSSTRTPSDQVPRRSRSHCQFRWIWKH